MKAILCLVALCAFVSATQMALDDKIIAEVNAAGRWKAARNKRFENVTLAEAKALCGTKLGLKGVPVAHFTEKVAIPDSFDARQQWGNKIHPIRDQAQCGSCWAFGATEALSDRFAIGGTDVILSPQDLVSCNKPQNFGCQGGYLDKAWLFMQENGVVSDMCYPYTSGGGVDGMCHNGTCTGAGQAWKVYKSQAAQMFMTVEDIQQEVMTNGPVEVAFSVYQDFFSYHGGVYTHKSGGLAGGHAVKLIGWGVDAGVNYWLIANSWGVGWGLQGFFMIERGINECGIESNVIAGKPNLM